MDKSKITRSLAVFTSVLLIIIIGVASFAYFGTFNVNLNNNVAVNINSSSPGNATFTSNATQLNLQVPAANMSFTVANNTVAAKEDIAFLDVTLTGSSNLLTTCTYDIVYEYDAGSNVYGQGTTTKTSGATKEITIEVNGMNGNNHFATETNFDHASIQSYYDSTNKYYKLVENATIKSLGTEQSVRWKIIGRYYNLEVSQSQLSGQAFTGKIYAVNKGCSSEDGSSVKKGYETILANNGGVSAIETKGTPDFSTTATENEGMYKTTDDLGTSYYFRGAVDNNWVKFGKYMTDVYYGWDDNNTVYSISNSCDGLIECKKLASKGTDMYWRIIRVNGDNSIRMIYAGTYAPDANTKVNMTNVQTDIGKISFDNFSDTVDYMYTKEESKEGTFLIQHGTTTDGHMKKYLDKWFVTTSIYNDYITKSLLADQIFCNDRTLSTISNGTPGEVESINMRSSDTYYYGAYLRIIGSSSNSKPSLLCTNVNDKFTTTTSKGNGKLTYPVGLLTGDEANMAGGDNKHGKNSSYYLYTALDYWLGSPFLFESGIGYPFAITEFGELASYNRGDKRGTRPVISLSSDVKLLGSGTYDDVYIVS